MKAFTPLASRRQAAFLLPSRAFLARIKYLSVLLCWGILCALTTAAAAQTIQWAVIERGTSAQADLVSNAWRDSSHGTTCGMTSPPFRGAVVGDWNIKNSGGTSVAESTPNCNGGWSAAIGGQITVPNNAAAGVYSVEIHEEYPYTPNPNPYHMGAGFRMATYKFQVVTLTLTCNNASVMQNPASVMVGQQVALKAVITPTQTATYSWTVGGEKVAGYTRSSSSATKTEFDAATLTQQNPTPFYFTNGSPTGTTANVSCTATVNGKAVSANGEIKVFTPELTTKMVTKNGVQVSVGPFKAKWTTENPRVAIRSGALVLGNPDTTNVDGSPDGKQGINFEAAVKTPSWGGAGAIGFVQLTAFTNKWQFQGSTNNEGYTSGKDANNSPKYVLDNGAGLPYGGGIGIGSNDTQALFDKNDSPAISLPSTGYDRAEAVHSFDVYLTYRPTDGIWVTIAKLSSTWGWTGVANKVTTWSLASGSTNPSGDLTGITSHDFPLWDDSSISITSKIPQPIP